MPQVCIPLPTEISALPETMKKFREHAELGHYALALRYHEQGRAAIDNFVASSEVMMGGDRSRRTKWRGLAAELDAEVKVVKVCDYSQPKARRGSTVSRSFFSKMDNTRVNFAFVYFVFSVLAGRACRRRTRDPTWCARRQLSRSHLHWDLSMLHPCSREAQIIFEKQVKSSALWGPEPPHPTMVLRTHVLHPKDTLHYCSQM